MFVFPNNKPIFFFFSKHIPKHIEYVHRQLGKVEGLDIGYCIGIYIN